MSDEDNHSTQISTKKRAVNKTTLKCFANRRREGAIAYGWNPSVNNSLWSDNDLDSVPSRGDVVVFFFNC